VAQWRADHRALLASQRGLKGPRMMAGDFNATLDHGAVRRLLDTGLHDAAREARSGVQPTWPAPRWMRVFWVRPPFSLITIDHVLVSRDFAAVSTSAHTISDSDHRGLVARLRLR
jgi:endonuclease/exonuclease/phosphatase (EEP) superfamily protein YafD